MDSGNTDQIRIGQKRTLRRTRRGRGIFQQYAGRGSVRSAWRSSTNGYDLVRLMPSEKNKFNIAISTFERSIFELIHKGKEE